MRHFGQHDRPPVTRSNGPSKAKAMDIFSESALEREGALAAAHGQSWQSNPFLHKHNMPQESGELLGDWSCRHDAWQRGFEG
jgi:hypothetical protein